MAVYRITARQYSDGGRVRRGFGVVLYVGGVCVREAQDLSDDRAAIQRLVALFNEEDLDPVHFEQAIEDFLYDLTV